MKGQRIRNWKEYNKSLVSRGNVTLWFSEEVLSEPTVKSGCRGRPYQYTERLIEMALTLKQVYHLTLRSLQGFLESLKGLFPGSGRFPHYSTLCRRQKDLKLSPMNLSRRKGPVDIVVDSTGLKIYGEGEWCVYKHGKQYQRTWRKVHLAVEADSLQIVANALTSSRTQDSLVLDRLLKQTDGDLNRVIGDGAYDTFHCYHLAEERGAKGIFPPQTGARLSEETPRHRKPASPEAIAQRDQAVEQVRSLGKDQWKKEVNYHQRSLAETTMFRLKTILGDRLKAKNQASQRVELGLRCRILNKMIQLGRPVR